MTPEQSYRRIMAAEYQCEPDDHEIDALIRSHRSMWQRFRDWLRTA